ncbi:hypothetical protein [Peribacillus psychrosaccharolyticus]|uniref:hypothetical protein n=1 Tax=Peribacillus psychrosaccharolyticus TaxID=1407 RepID=UPI0002E050AB|nr:hypothetical protein [Peribacillus psychrosaccharolyticus]
MTIKKKILLNSLIGLALSILMIAFIIFRMLSIQTSNQDYVKVLLTVGSLKAETNASMQSLNTFAFNMTDANKNIAINDLENTGATYKELDSILKEKQSRKVLKDAETKFKILQKEAIAALTESNASEVKRQSLRTKGIANDIYLLDLYTTKHYTYLEETMKSDIEFVIMFALIGSVIVAIITTLFILRMANKITNPLKN